MNCKQDCLQEVISRSLECSECISDAIWCDRRWTQWRLQLQNYFESCGGIQTKGILGWNRGRMGAARTKRNLLQSRQKFRSILMQNSDSRSRTCRSFYCLEIISLNWLSLAGGPGSPSTTVNLQSSLLKPHQSMVLLLRSPFVLAHSRERSKPAKIMPETISRRNGASTTRNCYQIT